MQKRVKIEFLEEIGCGNSITKCGRSPESRGAGEKASHGIGRGRPITEVSPVQRALGGGKGGGVRGMRDDACAAAVCSSEGGVISGSSSRVSSGGENPGKGGGGIGDGLGGGGGPGRGDGWRSRGRAGREVGGRREVWGSGGWAEGKLGGRAKGGGVNSTPRCTITMREVKTANQGLCQRARRTGSRTVTISALPLIGGIYHTNLTRTGETRIHLAGRGRREGSLKAQDRRRGIDG